MDCESIRFKTIVTQRFLLTVTRRRLGETPGVWALRGHVHRRCRPSGVQRSFFHRSARAAGRHAQCRPIRLPKGWPTMAEGALAVLERAHARRRRVAERLGSMHTDADTTGPPQEAGECMESAHLAPVLFCITPFRLCQRMKRGGIACRNAQSESYNACNESVHAPDSTGVEIGQDKRQVAWGILSMHVNTELPAALRRQERSSAARAMTAAHLSLFIPSPNLAFPD